MSEDQSVPIVAKENIKLPPRTAVTCEGAVPTERGLTRDSIR